MKKFVCFLALAVTTFCADAQFASLDKNEVKLIRETLKKDRKFSKIFKNFQVIADQSLSETPNPIAVILSQGLLAGDPRKTASLKALEDVNKVYALAFAYKISGKTAYLNKATDFFTAWAKINKATDDPINQTKLEDMVTAYDLVREDVTSESRTLTDNWLRSIADAMVDSKYAKGSRGTAINNWNSHRIKMITLIAYTLHDNKYDGIITTELEKQLNVNLNPDGTTHDLMERDAFHYQTYDIEPLISACIAIYRATGKNYFTWKTTNGSTIKNCIDYMTPYMTGEKTHPEFVKSTVPFDKKRAENGEKGYAPGTLFEPVNGVHTFSLAAYFDKGYNKIIRLAMHDDNYLNWRMSLNTFTVIKP